MLFARSIPVAASGPLNQRLCGAPACLPVIIAMKSPDRPRGKETDAHARMQLSPVDRDPERPARLRPLAWTGAGAGNAYRNSRPRSCGVPEDLRQQDIGDVQFSVIDATRQEGVRDTSGPHGASSRFDLVYMHSGGITLRQNGREASLVALPSAWIERWLPDPYACTIRPLIGTPRWGAAMLRSIALDVKEGGLCPLIS